MYPGGLVHLSQKKIETIDAIVLLLQTLKKRVTHEYKKET